MTLNCTLKLTYNNCGESLTKVGVGHIICMYVCMYVNMCNEIVHSVYNNQLYLAIILDEGAVSGRSNSKSGDGAVGGAIGVCVALLAIITVTCVVVVVVIKHRKRREVISLENAIYGGKN